MSHTAKEERDMLLTAKEERDMAESEVILPPPEVLGWVLQGWVWLYTATTYINQLLMSKQTGVDLKRTEQGVM